MSTDMTEDEIASKAETLDSANAYTGFQHFWNIVATTGGISSLKNLAHSAFLAGVATGEARSAVRNGVPLPTYKPTAETPEELAKHRTNHVFNDQPSGMFVRGTPNVQMGWTSGIDPAEGK